MKTNILFSLCCLASLATFEANATHIVGGVLNYRSLTNNDYEIRLTLYRDCLNGAVLFDDPASVGIFNSGNTLIKSINMSFLGSTPVTNAINSPCLLPSTTACYEVTTYIDTVNLPPITGGYQLVYQRCCRSSSVINISAPSTFGTTYTAHIPDPASASVNSNPVFKSWCSNFICVNNPFTFDHSATDQDGDSLVYSLITPHDGASATSPMPQPPNAPPYNVVPWLAPYSLSNAFGGVPLTINSSTGILTAIPNTIGAFVYGVSVKEYRNGTFLGETMMDFQVYIVTAVVGTEENAFENKDVYLYPDPAKDQLTIKPAGNMVIKKYTISNLTGQVLGADLHANSIDISSLKPGLYFITLETGSDLKLTNKFIKE